MFCAYAVPFSWCVAHHFFVFPLLKIITEQFPFPYDSDYLYKMQLLLYHRCCSRYAYYCTVSAPITSCRYTAVGTCFGGGGGGGGGSSSTKRKHGSMQKVSGKDVSMLDTSKTTLMVDLSAQL